MKLKRYILGLISLLFVAFTWSHISFHEDEFEVVEISSSIDSVVQKAIFRKS